MISTLLHWVLGIILVTIFMGLFGVPSIGDFFSFPRVWWTNWGGLIDDTPFPYYIAGYIGCTIDFIFMRAFALYFICIVVGTLLGLFINPKVERPRHAK